MSVLLKCGHAANAVDQYGYPCCAICYGIRRGSKEIETKKVDLTSRAAVCSACLTARRSSLSLPFFEYRSHKLTDSFYCGCRGWN